MRKVFVAAAIVFVAFHGPAEADATRREAAKNSKKMIKELGMELKSNLKSAIKNSGFGAAIGVCRSIAPQAAMDIGEKHGATIRRVSLKLRNKGNAPDKVEMKMLERMEADHAAGMLRSFYTAMETVPGEGKRLRLMKPIMTQRLCLNCHGHEADLNPEAEAAIRTNYPDDDATGYDVNQVRGAFSVIYPLN
ncbi:MAG: Tll0287-like domain-containing protein [Candidatus Nitrospinota bacterium M3_3B_026]